MKHSLLLSLLFLFTSCNFSSQNEIVVWKKDLTTEQNIAANAKPYQTNTEFPFLKDIVKQKDIIILGEADHWELTTNETRINMVKTLSRQGVQIVAIEGVSFFPVYVLYNSEYSEATKDWKLEYFWQMPISGHSARKLFLELIANQNIRVFGIDIEASSKDVECLKLLLQKYMNDTPLEINWDRFSFLYNRKFVDFRLPENITATINEQYELMKIINTIYNYVEYIIFTKEENLDLKVIKQWMKNINTNFSFVEEYDPVDIKKTTFIFRNRDFQMAENIMFITENFPQEKVCVWCANFHGAKDISQTIHSSDSLLYFRFQSMGETLYNYYQNKLYSIGFSSFNEENGENTLEAEIKNYSNQAPYAFIDFESLRFAERYRNKSFETSLFTKKGKWLNIFDGYYYILEQDSIKLE